MLYSQWVLIKMEYSRRNLEEKPVFEKVQPTNEDAALGIQPEVGIFFVLGNESDEFISRGCIYD